MVTQAMMTAIAANLQPLTIINMHKPPQPPWLAWIEEAADKPDNPRTSTHNGIFTAKLSDGHKTFKIRTQPKGSKFMGGKRVVYLLTGSNPDDYESWQSFGVMTAMGVILWKSKRSRVWKYYANLLATPEKHPKVEWNSDEVCMYCNRMLTTPRSAELGYGPTCARRRKLPY